MEKKEIIQKTLENLKVEASENNLFIFEILLEKETMKRITLMKLIQEKGASESSAREVLNTLNKNNIIKWEVVKGVAIVRLTKKAIKEFVLVYLSITGDKYGKEIKALLSSGGEHLENFLNDLAEEGKRFGEKFKKQLSKSLHDLASRIDKNS